MNSGARKIEAIIFDLGGVLVDLDIEKCKAAFRKNLSYDGIDSLIDACHQKGMYSDLEEGILDPDEFRARILAESVAGGKPEDVDRSMWELLAGMAGYKAGLLRRLSSSGYRLFLLSNNNPISMKRCLSIFEENGIDAESIFEKMYLSYEMKMLKPSSEIFESVIRDTGLVPASILFIDDSPANVDAAFSSGMNVLPYVQGTDLEHAVTARLEELERC